MNQIDIKLAIFEAAEAGKITAEQKEELLKAYQESFLATPVSKFLKKLEEIKKERPSEYDGPEEVKKFVDKNYEDIVKCANLLEKEPEKLRKDDIVFLVTIIPRFYGGLGVIAASAFVIETSLPAAIAVIVAGVVMLASLAVQVVLRYIRANKDEKAMDELVKIKGSIKKVSNLNLPEEDKKKIEKTLRSIEDAETSVMARMKMIKESEDMKLEIFEAAEAGKITEEQKKNLLALVDEKLTDEKLLEQVGKSNV